jgi:hypothetical protein
LRTRAKGVESEDPRGTWTIAVREKPFTVRVRVVEVPGEAQPELVEAAPAIDVPVERTLRLRDITVPATMTPRHRILRGDFIPALLSVAHRDTL